MRAVAVFFVGHEEFQCAQKKGSEPALFGISAIEISAFQHADEEPPASNPEPDRPDSRGGADRRTADTNSSHKEKPERNAPPFHVDRWQRPRGSSASSETGMAQAGYAWSGRSS